MSLIAPAHGLRRLLRQPQRLRHLAQVRADYAAFQRAYGFLAEGVQDEDPSRRLLIVSLTDWVAQIKSEVMLATALRLRGVTPWVVTDSRHRQAMQYFRSCGITRFVLFDRETAAQRHQERPLHRVARELLAGAPTFQTLLQAQYRGVSIGRHVLSSIVRKLLTGRVELGNAEVRRLLYPFLLQALRAVHTSEALLDRVSPCLVLFLEKGYSPYGELFDVAVNRHLNTIQWFQPHRSDALAFKRYTHENRHRHPFSLSEQTWEAVKRMAWTEARAHELTQEISGRYADGSWFSRKFLRDHTSVKSVDAVRQHLALNPTKKTAVIFSHVLWDATFFYGDNLFNDYEQWLVETVKAACANPAVNWIVKLHPDYTWKLKNMGVKGKPRDYQALQDGVGRLPDHVKVIAPETDLSACSLFPVTDYCLTVRGTVGIEMACAGIPVITAGTGRYSGLGFTLDSQTSAEYLARIRSIQHLAPLTPDQIQLAKRYAYALFRLRPCVCRTFELVQWPLHRVGHPLDHNVVIRARCWKDITNAEDLQRIAAWAMDSDGEDFLSSWPEGLAPTRTEAEALAPSSNTPLGSSGP